MGYDFWKAALIRAAHTFFQAFIAAIPSSAAVLSDVNWKLVFSAAVLAAVMSLAKSVVVGLPEVALQNTLYDLDNDPEGDEEEEFEPYDEIGLPTTEEGDE